MVGFPRAKTQSWLTSKGAQDCSRFRRSRDAGIMDRMHMLSSHNRSEFLATPQLLRFDYVDGRDGFEATLLVKGNTLLLKYMILGARMQLAFSRLGDRLLYALKIYDDNDQGGVLWSILERENEKQALMALAKGEPCQTFLFNEIAVNVAWAELPIQVDTELSEMVAEAATGPVDHASLENAVSTVLNRFHREGKSGDNLVVAEVPATTDWNPLKNHYITNQASSSLIDLFNQDEGNQQEQIALWLTDNLHPRGVFLSPQIPKGKGVRELTDVLISYPLGSTLIESKALTILTRERLPDRAKLARDVAGHIEKAANQLRGGMRRLKDGTPVTNKKGDLLDIERAQPMHGIILIPDLELIEDRQAYGLPFIEQFMSDTGGFIHLLDVSELLRIVQAAEMIAARGTTTTPMMAFDYYLIERAKKAMAAGTLCIEVLLRIVEE